jgi:hypothetical protein
MNASHPPERLPLAVRLVQAIGLIMLAAWLYLFYASWGSGLRTPDAASGRVYPINNHGKMTYVNRNESLLLDALGWGGFILFGGPVFWQVRR